jgi:hypothetical protein
VCAPAKVLNAPENLIVAVYPVGRRIVLLDYQSISLSDLHLVFRYRVDCLTSTQGSENILQTSPIRVSPKSKTSGAKRARNVFFNDRGFPDQSEEYDQLLHNIDGGVIL